jgi:hypothetical protein
MTFSCVKAPCQRRAQFSDEAMVRDPQVTKFEYETDQMGKKAWCMDSTVHENGAVDVGMDHW